MRCPYCGEELPEGSRFCSRCGGAVESQGYPGQNQQAPGTGGVQMGVLGSQFQNTPPVYGEAAPGGKKKGGKAKWIAIGAAAAVVAAGGAAAAAVLLTAKSPKEKVIAAFEHVFPEKGELPGEQVFGYSGFAELLKSGDFHQGMTVTLSKSSVPEAEMFQNSGVGLEVKRSLSSQKSSLDAGLIYNGMDLASARLYFGDKKLMAAVPQLSSNVFFVDLGSDLAGQLKGSPTIGPILEENNVDVDGLNALAGQVMDEMSDTETPAFDLAALMKRYQDGCEAKEKFKEALTVEKGEKRKFTVDGKEVNCQGYLTVVSKDAMIDFLEESADFFLQDETLREDFLNYLEIAAEFYTITEGGSIPSEESPEKMVQDAYREAKDQVEEMIKVLDDSMDDIEMNVYLDKKGNLAGVFGNTEIKSGSDSLGVEFEAELKGGAYPAQNGTVMVDFSEDDAHVVFEVERKGTFGQKELTDEITVDADLDGESFGGEYLFSYQIESGELQTQLSVRSGHVRLASLSLEGTVDELEKGKSIHMNLEDLKIQEHMSGQYVDLDGEFFLKPLEGEIEEPSGEMFDVLKATETEWMGAGMEIMQKAQAVFGEFF